MYRSWKSLVPTSYFKKGNPSGRRNMIYKNMDLNQGMESIGHDNYVGKYKTK